VDGFDDLGVVDPLQELRSDADLRRADPLRGKRWIEAKATADASPSSHQGSLI
jgi:hypothetical protein